MSTQTLTPSEETLLAELVQQYRAADSVEAAANAQLKQAWRQKGAALIEINESRLYRQTHETFEAFAKAEFGLSRERAYQLMKAEEGALMAQAVGMVMQNESQARALADVPADKQSDVLNIVHAKQEAGEKITAQTIQQAGASVTSTATEPQPNVKKVSQTAKALSVRGKFEELCESLPPWVLEMTIPLLKKGTTELVPVKIRREFRNPDEARGYVEAMHDLHSISEAQLSEMMAEIERRYLKRLEALNQKPELQPSH